MAIAELTLAYRVLSKPLNDLYEAGKAKFATELTKWKNSSDQKRLIRKIVNIQNVKTFWQRDKEVPIYSFFYPSPICFEEGVVKEIASLKTFPNIGNFVIQGTVGQGKSVFLRNLCVQEATDNGSGRIPVFVELRHVNEKGLFNLLTDALDRLGFIVNEELFDYYANSGKLVLLLDGFDEIEDGLISGVISELDRYSEKYENLQIIITSRPSSSIQNSRHFRVVKLAPLKQEDHPKFLKRIGLSNSESNSIINAINSSNGDVAGLLTTPLMLTLLVVVYRAEQSIPNEVPEFYERLFQTLFSKHDSIKPGLPKRHKSGLGERQLQSLFEAFCFSVLQLRKKPTLSTDDFSKSYSQAIQYFPTKCEEDAFKHDITKAVCLMQEEGFDLHFIHKSVLEFFAASFVRDLVDETAQKFYSQLAQSESWYRWRQVIQFLSQIDKYKYAKNFAIPLLLQNLSNYGLSREKRELLDVKAVMSNEYLGQDITYFQGEDGNFNLSSLGAPHRLGNIFNELSIEPLINVIFDEKYQKQTLTEEQLLKDYEALKFTTARGNEYFHVKWDKLITAEEMDTMCDYFQIYLSGLYDLLDSFEAYVASENQMGELIQI